MRCDWPSGYDEDCIEPPCEIFLQLFIENAEIVADDVPSNDDNDFSLENSVDEPLLDDEIVNLIDDDDLSDDSDDFLTYSCPCSDPSIHTISDTSMPSTIGEFSSDEGEVESEEPRCEESNNEEHCIRNSVSDMSQYSEESWYPENMSSEESEHSQEFDVFLDTEQVTESSCVVSNQISEDCGEDATTEFSFQEIGNSEEDSSNELQLSSEMPHREESAAESSDISGSLSSTYVSLYVVAPPTNVSNESDKDLLPESDPSSDRLFSSLIPLNPPCSPASLMSENENSHSNHVQNSSKVSGCLEELTSETPALSNITPTEEDDKKFHSLPEFDSVLDNMNRIVSDSKSETTYNDLHPEFLTCDANLSEESGIVFENNAEKEVISDKSIPSLKRKVGSSVDDNIVSKVPKYSPSNTSNESVNQGSLDNYCKVLSNSTEKITLHEEDKIDIIPSSVTGENIVLSLGKAVEGTSEVIQKPKCR